MKEIIELSNKTITIERNGYLKVKGTVDTNIYFVESGSLKKFVLNDLEEQIMCFAYRNDLIVSIDSFLTGKPSDFYIQAIKKTVLKVIPKKVFTEFIFQSEQNTKMWIQILEDIIMTQMEREKDILENSARKRYNRVLKRHPELFQQIPSTHIANYLRMSPETLSRLRKS
jgi:CRP-like cAMP-binding protein